MIDAKATANARSGETIAGQITLLRIPPPRMALVPCATHAAPTSPPMSACDELEGSPCHQVIRFQAMAPTRAANTTVVVVAWVETMPLAIVVATLTEINAPAKLKIAE